MSREVELSSEGGSRVYEDREGDISLYGSDDGNVTLLLENEQERLYEFLDEKFDGGDDNGRDGLNLDVPDEDKDVFDSFYGGFVVMDPPLCDMYIEDGEGNPMWFSRDESEFLYDLLSDEFDNDDSGPATKLLSNMDIPSMNTQTIEVDERPIDELFGDMGRVMAENDREHDRVVTMSDVDAEIQSLAERVTELERGEQQ